MNQIHLRALTLLRYIEIAKQKQAEKRRSLALGEKPTVNVIFNSNAMCNAIGFHEAYAIYIKAELTDYEKVELAQALIEEFRGKFVNQETAYKIERFSNLFFQQQDYIV